MPFFKAPNNSLHRLDDPSFAYLLPAGAVQITDAEAAALQAPPPAPLVPDVVTMRQARLALLAAGKLDAVNAVMAQSPRPVQITWDTAGTVERTNPLIEALAPQLGLTDAALDNLFIEAAKL